VSCGRKTWVGKGTFHITPTFRDVTALNITCIFYIHGSGHRDSILIRSNEMQQYVGVYLMQNYSTCFGCLSHQSSGLHRTVTAASGTGHSVRKNLPPVWRN